MKVTLCDRCGATEAPFHWKRSDAIKGLVNKNDLPIDLCEGCNRALRDWIEMERSKRSALPPPCPS